VTLESHLRLSAAAPPRSAPTPPTCRPTPPIHTPPSRPHNAKIGLTPYPAHCYELFCHHEKLIPFLFNPFHTLCAKHPGWGGWHSSCPFRLQSPPCNVCLHRGRLQSRVTNHQSTPLGPHTKRRNSISFIKLPAKLCIPPGYTYALCSFTYLLPLPPLPPISALIHYPPS
jgi:hypothetical protein